MTHAQRGLENKMLSRLSFVSRPSGCLHHQSPIPKQEFQVTTQFHKPPGYQTSLTSLAIKDFSCVCCGLALVCLAGWFRCWGPCHANSVSEPHLQPPFCSLKPTVSTLSSPSHPHSCFQRLSQMTVLSLAIFTNPTPHSPKLGIPMFPPSSRQLCSGLRLVLTLLWKLSRQSWDYLVNSEDCMNRHMFVYNFPSDVMRSGQGARLPSLWEVCTQRPGMLTQRPYGPAGSKPSDTDM